MELIRGKGRVRAKGGLVGERDGAVPTLGHNVAVVSVESCRDVTRRQRGAE